MGRSTESETLRQSVIARGIVDLHGPDGAGKSSLAAALVHTLDLSHFPDGTVFFTGPIRYSDLLQVLFDSFYESDVPVKVTLQQTHSYLRSLRVLVILDDVGLGPKQIDPVLDALDEAAVFIVGPERTALGRGRALRLKGLPRQEAIALFEKGMGRALEEAELAVVDELCSVLNDMPLPISGTAKHAAQSRGSLTRLLSNLQDRKPWAGKGGDLSVGPSLEQLVLTLDAADRELLTLIGAFAGTSASSEALRGLTNLSPAQFKEHVDRLEHLGLLCRIQPIDKVLAPGRSEASAPRLALNSAYHQTVKSWLVDEAARKGIVNHYASQLQQGVRLPANELPSLVGAIEECAHHGWLDQLELLARAADHSLAELCWWAEWQHLLDVTRRAAQAGGDQALEAWAMHQLGSLLGASSVFERAFPLLETAFNMRQALGDGTGAELSARNLAVLERLMPTPVVDVVPQREKPAPTRERTEEPSQALLPEPERIPKGAFARWARRLGTRLILLTALALLVICAVAVRFATGLSDGRDAVPDLTVSWEFGDAWNAFDSETWTQQIKIIVEGGDGNYRYFVNGEPTGEILALVLPLCDGAQGTIQVESASGQTSQVDYAFDSPYCR
jgi:hypothetical protein